MRGQVTAGDSGGLPVEPSLSLCTVVLSLEVEVVVPGLAVVLPSTPEVNPPPSEVPLLPGNALVLPTSSPAPVEASKPSLEPDVWSCELAPEPPEA